MMLFNPRGATWHNRCVPGLLVLTGLLQFLCPQMTGALNAAPPDDRPNVVVIITDDQGWGDLSIHGNCNLSTPNLDSLAREGASFKHFYVCQVCAPTRAELMTGRYYPRTGVSGVSRGEERMNADETTVAELLQQSGYATGAFGKWHNGTQPPLHPNHRGFDEFYGFTSGHWGHYFSPPLDHNGTRVRGQGFLVDDFTDHAIDFIGRDHGRPFFCYLAINTPHSPMMVSDRFYKKFQDEEPVMRHRDPEREDVMMTRAALAMCENIDWNVGRLLSSLEQQGLEKDTVVIYLSDNGPNSYRWNGGMKGRKGSIDEGGLRSPLFIRWPSKIRSGSVVDSVAGAIDLLPTLLEITSTGDRPEKPLDGVSLVPLLFGRVKTLPERSLFSIKNRMVSVRTQRFRLDEAGRLFDIPADQGQREDVSEQHPQIAAELKRQAREHGKSMAICFEQNADRPFHVGFGRSTTLPARDGVAHGTIERSSKAPNNSFFTHWTSLGDSITWQVQVGTEGDYEAIVYYTCAAGDEGSTIRLSMSEGDSVSTTVTEVFDPPLYDKSKERVEKSHYFVKDFKPLRFGRLKLREGVGELRLDAVAKPGNAVIDVHSVELNLIDRK